MLLIIRHCQSEANLDPAGCPDGSLTNYGRRQAQALASWFLNERVDIWLTSPACRAIETAAVIAETTGARVWVWPELCERVGGDLINFQGQPAVILLSKYHCLRWRKGAKTERWWAHNPETISNLRERTHAVKELLFALNERKIGIITHTVFGMTLLRYLAPSEQPKMEEKYLHQATITRLLLEPDGGKILSLNEDSYLQHLGEF